MPSTTSSSVSRLLASSMVITPSLPTLSIALAIMSPIALSPLADTVPTCAISSPVETLRERLLSSSITHSAARSMPRLRSMGFMPAATDLAPSRTIAWASTVAVVVPSPAVSDVLVATSRTSWAPIFSNLSESSISLATVTPSLVMRGEPYDLSSTTLRPLGPSVTFTESARISTPRIMRARASPPKRTSFAAMVLVPCFEMLLRSRPASRRLLLGDGDTWAFDDAHDVRLLHDEEILAIELDLRAGPLAEQDAVTLLDVERNQRALLVTGARADGGDLAFHRLFLGGVRNDDATLGLAFFLDTLDHDPVLKRTELNGSSSNFFGLWCERLPRDATTGREMV